MKKVMQILVYGFLLPMGAALPASAADFDSSLATLQHDWATINYERPAKERAAQFEALAEQAAALSQQYPDRVEAMIWEGIALSSYAGAKGGVGALGLAKKARKKFEAAIDIDEGALDGSALVSLGTLYHKVPGWPLGFGSDKKAKAFLLRGLDANPLGIDANYFYGEFLLDKGDEAGAVRHLQRVLDAPDRAGRSDADRGRQADARKLLDRLQAG